ncbi:glycoside hydrolase family 25 protein [Leptospira sp. 201903070]|uniref:Glycoside hydrolase family 25 protein n=1 Tax=Leptospira ainlahdjerensis TaxID=2810033 RepID=A0ABS2UCP8_9LEPT|nr:GH25 family lysozyme [Leptospira ainlahdjerensis]MBM9578145.1 glycoside hydrolase family 25 protein [Leptospira ainlahdjerensis]
MKLKIPFTILWIVGLLFGAYKALDSGRIWFVYPSEQKYPIRGIDVSHHQGKIDWNLVPKSEVSFVYLKATEGAEFQDPFFRTNWKEARGAGFPVGAYHFFTLCKTGIEQAENFMKRVPKEPNSLPPVIDLEFTGNCKERSKLQNVQNEIRDFLDRVDFYYGKKTILYLTFEFIDQYLGEEFFGHPIWIRDIYKHPNTFSDIRWSLWQYKNRGRISGVEGYVDLNVWNGSLEELFSKN